MSKKPAALPWPNLQALIDDHGSFVVGYVSPIPCAAIASDQHKLSWQQSLRLCIQFS